MAKVKNREALGLALIEVSRLADNIKEFGIVGITEDETEALIEQKAQEKEDRGEGNFKDNLPGMRKWIEGMIRDSKVNPNDLLERAYQRMFYKKGDAEEAEAAVIAKLTEALAA